MPRETEPPREEMSWGRAHQNASLINATLAPQQPRKNVLRRVFIPGSSSHNDELLYKFAGHILTGALCHVQGKCSLQGPGVYFLRINPSGVRAKDPELDLAYGEIPHTALEDFNTVSVCSLP